MTKSMWSNRMRNMAFSIQFEKGVPLQCSKYLPFGFGFEFELSYHQLLMMEEDKGPTFDQNPKF